MKDKAIFIDTNIFLLFYHFAKDDLSILKKLKGHLSSKNLTLYLTNQVKDEFLRNRENKILDALKQFENVSFSCAIPTLCKNFEEDCDELSTKQKEFQLAHTTLLNKVKEAAIESELNADRIIESIFNAATFISVNDDVYHSAIKRTKVGNSPGKNNDIGDRINWELLLNHVEEETDLIIISADRDYSSSLDDKMIHPFLRTEWKERKKSKIEETGVRPDIKT